MSKRKAFPNRQPKVPTVVEYPATVLEVRGALATFQLDDGEVWVEVNPPGLVSLEEGDRVRVSFTTEQDGTDSEGEPIWKPIVKTVRHRTPRRIP